MNMTREEIERLEGRKLDVAVAEKVQGWVGPAYWVGDEPFMARRVDGRPRLVEGPFLVGRYSTDIVTAWAVVETMRKRGYWFEIDEMTCPPGHPCDIRCRFVRNPHDARERLDNTYSGSGSLATAICRAALIALANEEAETNDDD